MPIAITGGIAEGKSTVLSILAELGFKTISADDVARDLYFRNEVQKALSLAANLPIPIDRDRLRDQIVDSPVIRRRVNRVMHSGVVEAILASDSDFAEVPLLLETCAYGGFDEVWVVTCGDVEQRSRLRSRYGPEVDCDAILATQLPTIAKVPFADVVIRTNQSFEAVRRSISLAIECSLGLS